MDLEKIMKEERIKQGLSQQKLANAAGVSRTEVGYWEIGKRHLSLNNADKVFKVLGITVQIGAETGVKK